MAGQLPAIPARLPRMVKPYQAETTLSYLARLAHANRLEVEWLRFYLSGSWSHAVAVPAGRLAAVAGFPARVLGYAIPDLGLDRGRYAQYYNGMGLPQRRGDDGLACRLCVLARGITEPVRCWKRPENMVCLRHRLWIWPGHNDDQPDLSAQPAVLQAQRRHLRLVRRYGRDMVAMEFATADHICREWHERGRHDVGFRERMEIFHGPGWKVRPTDATVAAAIYPQAIALTRLLICPFWRSLSAPSNKAGLERFAEEVRRTVAPGYVWPQPSRPADPLEGWVTERRLSRQRPALITYHTWPLPDQQQNAAVSLRR